MFARWGQSVSDSYLSKSETQDYVPLSTSEDNKELGVDFRPEKKYKWHTIYNVLLVSFCMVGCGFIGFTLGYRSRSSSSFKAKGFAIFGKMAVIRFTDERRLLDSAGRGQVSNGV